MDVATRQVICHWHLQLSDPMYRRFTAFPRRTARFSDPEGRSRHRAALGQERVYAGWGESTCVQFASKLLSAASEAGLSHKRDPRALILPKAPDIALAYLLHLLRGVSFARTLTKNPYLASVGLAEGFLDQRLRSLPGVSFHRMAKSRLRVGSPNPSRVGGGDA